MTEQNTQEQPAGQEGTPVESTPQPSALEERLAKLEGAVTDQKGYITKLEQENSTYRQIITDRGQADSAQATRQPVTVSELDKEIETLERQAAAGEITAEDLSVRSLQLIRKAKSEGRQEAVREVTNLYSQEQEISRSFASIFEDPDLKGLDKDMNDIAYGYMQAGISQGMNVKRASEYAKDQTKQKLVALRARFGGQKSPEPQKETPAASLKGEGEQNKQPPKKEEPVTAESSQASFIEQRRARMMR